MNIIINGKEVTLDESISLKELVEQYASNPERTVAEVNGNIVEVLKWESVRINNGDTIELVSFVGGG